MSEPIEDTSRRIERDGWLLWTVTFVLVFSLSITVYLLYLRMTTDLREAAEPSIWIQSGYTTGICLVGLVCIFILYTVIQQVELKRLRFKVAGEERELENLRARLTEISNLFEVATELNLRLPVETILSIMVRRVVSALKAQQASVMLFNPENQSLETRAYYGVEGEFTALGRVRLGEGIAGKVAEDKRPLILDGETKNPDLTQHFKPYRNITSALSIPLVVDDACVGVLNVNRINHPHLFNDRQKEILRLFAGNIAGVIRRAEAEEKLVMKNEELEVTNEKLREMNRMKEIFLSTASHELKTPLTSVIGYAELLNDHELGAGSPATSRVHPAPAFRGRKQLLRLIEDILDLTRLETGKLELKRGRLSFSELVRSAVETVRPLAQKSGVRLTEEYEGEDDAAYLDEVKVRQATVNLIVNAIKFSPSQGEVRVRTRREPEGLVAEISDEGPGRRRKRRRRSSRSSDRVYAPAPRGAAGWASGSHLVKGIVELHGGRVGVKARPGGGSIFWMRIPRDSNSLEARAA